RSCKLCPAVEQLCDWARPRRVALRHAQDFLEAGQTGARTQKARLAQRNELRAPRQLPIGALGRPRLNEIPEVVVDLQHLEDPSPSAITGAVTPAAADRTMQNRAPLE